MSKPRTGLVCLLLALPLALIVTEIRHYSINTLSENGRWVSAKSLMQIPLMGARQFLVTRNALAGNRLDLRAWHGYNEVYFHRPIRLGSLQLSFRLAERAHLSVIVGRTERDFRGARLSRHPKFSAMTFVADRSGRFVDQRPLEMGALDAGWHRLLIENSAGDWTITLDDTTVGALGAAELPAGLIGFRSGFSRVEIDDVRIEDDSGELAISEGFRHRRGYWGSFLASLAVVCLVLIGIAWLASRRESPGSARPAQWVTLFVLVATFAGIILFAFDYYVWSRSYIYQERNPNAPAPPAVLAELESWRQSLFGAGSIETLDLPVEDVAHRVTRWDLSGEFVWSGPNRWSRFSAYTSKAPGRPRYLSSERLKALDPQVDALRLAFIGSSQTVGVGAEVYEDALVSGIHRAISYRTEGKLTGSTPDTGSAEVWAFNLAIAGSWSSELLRSFEKSWIDLDPDLVAINLSFNDRDLPLFEASLRRFVEINRSRDIETLLIVEAMSADKDDLGVRQRQAVVREVGQSMAVPVLDLESYLAGPAIYDSGFLWWDQVHMTSYGQQLASAWLAEQIAPYLASLPRR